MGMNNADFLSDAVALDLGKSGVKVAETLEIQVGDEWWRLINAADVATCSIFQSRRFQDPIISEGTLHLDAFTKLNYAVARSLPYTTQKALTFQHYPGVAFYTADGFYRYAVGYMSAYSSTASYFAFAVYDESGSVVSSVTVTGRSLTTDPGYVPVAVVVDTVNGRVIAASGATADNGVTFSTTKYTFMLNMATGAGSYSAMPSNAFIMLHCRSFAEAPGAAYSVLNGATLRVKKHSFVSGETWTAVMPDLNSTTDSVEITGAANFGTTPKMFYSRWHESVAMIWYDSAAHTPYYVLESEGWSTLHALPDFCNGGEWTLENFGNLAIPKNGEFLIGSLSRVPSGNITRPSGWTYPANFKLSSVFDLGNDQGVIWGSVGTTLYRLNLQISTMTITNVETAALTVLPSAGTYIHLLAVSSDGDKELYTITDIYTGSTADRLQYGVFVWKKSTGTILFEFGGTDRSSATYFPTTYNRSSPWNFICRMLSPNHLLMLRMYSDAYYQLHLQDYYVLSTSDIFACESRADFLALMLAKGVISKALSLYPNAAPSVSSCGPVFDPSVTLFDDAYYYVPTKRVYSSKSLAMRFRKDTFDMSLFYWGSTNVTFSSASDYIRHGLQKYSSENPYVSETSLSYIDNTQDGYVYTFSADLPALRYVYGTLSALTYSNRATLYIPDIHTFDDRYPISVQTNTYRTRLAIPMFGTNAYIWGVCHDGTVEGSAGRIVPLGHTSFRSLRKIGVSDVEGYSLSNVTNGEIKYAQLNLYEGGDLGKYVAISNTGMVYDVSGLEDQGGLLRVNFSGRGIHAVTGHAKHLWLDTLADVSEGAGDGYSGTGDGGSGGFAGYIYTYQDSEFTPYPFAREGIRAELSNISKTTKITLPETQDNLIRGMLAAGTDFRGSRCILRRVFPDHIDEPGADIVLLDGYIQDWSYVPGKKGIAFSVSKTLIDVGAQFPKRLMNMGCSHVFKGSRCRYLGEEGRCLKTRAFCTSLGNLNQFGGFPWVAARQRRVMWK